METISKLTSTPPIANILGYFGTRHTFLQLSSANSWQELHLVKGGNPYATNIEHIATIDV